MEFEFKELNPKERPAAVLRLIIADTETEEILEDKRIYAIHGAMIAEEEHDGKKTAEGYSLGVSKKCMVIEHYRLIWLLKAVIRTLKRHIKEARRKV